MPVLQDHDAYQVLDDDFSVAVAAAHRRRVLAVLLMEDEESAGQGPQGPKLQKQTFSWEKHVQNLNEREFKLRYRLTPTAFYELLDLIKDDIDYTSDKARKLARNANGGVEVEPATRVA